jgi:hypothetical protein
MFEILLIVFVSLIFIGLVIWVSIKNKMKINSDNKKLLNEPKIKLNFYSNKNLLSIYFNDLIYSTTLNKGSKFVIPSASFSFFDNFSSPSINGMELDGWFTSRRSNNLSFIEKTLYNMVYPGSTITLTGDDSEINYYASYSDK